MKKLLIFLLVLGLLILGLTPGLMGFALNSYHIDAISGLDRSINGWRIEPQRFSRGWFSSELDLQITREADNALFQLPARIDHGLIPFSSGKPGLASVAGQLVDTNGTAYVHIDADLSLSAELAFQLIMEQSCTGAISGSVDRDFRELNVLFDEVTFCGIPIGLNEISGQLNLQRKADNLWKLVGGWTGQQMRTLFPLIQSEQFELNLSVERNADQIQFATGMSSAELLAGVENMQDFEAKLELGRLHAPTIDQLIQEIIRLSKANYTPAQLNQQIATAIFFALPKLLNNKPEINTADLQFANIHGQISATANATLVEPPPGGFMAQPDLLLDVTQFGIHAEFPRSWAKLRAEARAARDFPFTAQPEEISAAADQMLANLKANQVLVENGENYKFDVDFDRRQLTLNGQGMSLPDGFAF